MYYIVLYHIQTQRKICITYDKTNSNRDFRCLPLSSPTGLGVLEPLPKRSKAFNMSSDEILFSFPEHLSISFKSLSAKNCCFGLERSSVSCQRWFLSFLRIHIATPMESLRAQINQSTLYDQMSFSPQKPNDLLETRFLSKREEIALH